MLFLPNGSAGPGTLGPELSFEELNDLVGFRQYKALENRYASKPAGKRVRKAGG